MAFSLKDGELFYNGSLLENGILKQIILKHSHRAMTFAFSCLHLNSTEVVLTATVKERVFVYISRAGNHSHFFAHHAFFSPILARRHT